MPTITTRFETPDGSRYLQQLCKHFAHKAEVVSDDTTGKVIFPFGTGWFAADDQTLTMTADVNDAENVQQAIFVIEVHLLRFAWREDINLDWFEAHGGAKIDKSEKLETGLREQREKNEANRKK